jgi:hypothetical protein
MSVSDFRGKLIVPAAVASLDHNEVAKALVRYSCNVTDAAAELGVRPSDLRGLIWANPGLQDAALEQVEARLDKAEANILEALDSDDSRRRDAASFFVIRNSARARKRGWITTSTSAAEVSVSMSDNGPRVIRFRWTTGADEAERRGDDGQLIGYEGSSEP